MTVTAPRPEPSSLPRLRQAPVKRGRLGPLLALAVLTTVVATTLHLVFRASIAESGTSPVRVTGLSLVLAVLYLVTPPALLAVAARRSAWFAHWAAGAIAGLGVWFALGAMSPSLALAGAVGMAVALPVRYPLHRVVRVAVLALPGVFPWLVVGSGELGGRWLPTLAMMLATPLFLVVFDLVTWDGPRLVMRQLGRSKLAGRMDRTEAARYERQVAWQSWSVLGLLGGLALIALWWGGGRTPYQPSFRLVPVQIEATDTWRDVNGSYDVDWARSGDIRADAATVRVFTAGNRRVRLAVTNTGNPLLGAMYYESSDGATGSVESVSLNALGTPTIVRSDLVGAERLDCLRSNTEGDCRELVYTAQVDQYLVEVTMVRPRQLKVGHLSPIVDQVLDHIQQRLGR